MTHQYLAELQGWLLEWYINFYAKGSSFQPPIVLEAINNLVYKLNLFTYEHNFEDRVIHYRRVLKKYFPDQFKKITDFCVPEMDDWVLGEAVQKLKDEGFTLIKKKGN